VRKRLLIVGGFFLGIAAMEVAVACLLDWDFSACLTTLVPTAVMCAILLLDRFWVTAPSTRPPRQAGYLQAALGILFVAYGVFSLFDGYMYTWAYIGSAVTITAGAACLVLSMMRKQHDLNALILALLLMWIMNLSGWVDLYSGCAGVSGDCRFYDDFAVPFLVMLIIGTAGTALESHSRRFARLHVRATLPLVLVMLYFLLGYGLGYSMSGFLVGLVGAALPAAAPLLLLGVLVLPAGVRFGWAPWTGAPIDTLTPRVYILLGLALAMLVLALALPRVRRLRIPSRLVAGCRDLLLPRRLLVTTIAFTALTVWFCIGWWGESGIIMGSVFEPFVATALFLYLAKYLVDGFFGLLEASRADQDGVPEVT
jgi:hypothetical protein